MKRVFVLAFLPLVLFGLETVNLIKDAGFEKNSEMWLMYSQSSGDDDSTVINRHNPDSAYFGEFCASIDTRIQPADELPFLYVNAGYIRQLYNPPKQLGDLDSLILYHMICPRDAGNKFSVANYGLRLAFTNPSNEDFIEALYLWYAPDADPSDDTPTRKMFPDTVNDEGEWFSIDRDLDEDLVQVKGLSPLIVLDSFVIRCHGIYPNNWLGQKAFFDGIRLMGYADYDVGVKEILSGDSLEVGTPYQPEARIKNFGRENADSFLVMAEIWDGSSLIYVDTLPWSLDGDTEDTVTFTDFDPPTTGPYTLSISTHMEPDECDEDDEVSKEIGHSAIAEPVTHPDGLSLEVVGMSRGALKVSFETPNGKVGNLSVYDATGRRIERMAVTRSGSVEFNLSIPSGVYFVRLETDRSALVRKALMLK